MNAILNYHADAIKSFRNYKKLAEKALEQVADDHFFHVIDSESNSIGILVKHIAGNLHSRWSDFLNSDGEKSTRDRDSEFEQIGDGRKSLMQFWESGWETLFSALEPLEEADLSRTITIRGEPHTVVEAINRQLSHYAYHVGQIVFLAKHLSSTEWKTLSIPRNQSARFNQFLREKAEAGKQPTDRLQVSDEFNKL